MSQRDRMQACGLMLFVYITLMTVCLINDWKLSVIAKQDAAIQAQDMQDVLHEQGDRCLDESRRVAIWGELGLGMSGYDVFILHD